MITMTIDQTRRTSWQSVEQLYDEIQIIIVMMTKINMRMTRMITMTTDQTRRTTWQSVEDNNYYDDDDIAMKIIENYDL